MHYYVDGYNLLFRSGDIGDELHRKRDEIILALAEQVNVLELDVTLVFDALHQAGDSSRGHHRRLELIYTASGETADAYILHELQASRDNRQEIVVTSDKPLAEYARRLGAKTMSIHSFLRWVHARYAKRMRNRHKIKPLDKIRTSIEPSPSPPRPKTLEQRYEQVFESRFQELLAEEEVENKEKRRQSPSSKPKPKRTRSPVLKQSPESDMARWLRLFGSSTKNDE